MVYLIFIRPVVKYCLSICPSMKILTDMLVRFQGEALRAMFSCGPCTSQAAMRALTGVTTFEHRRLELRARFEHPVDDRDESHMATVIRRLVASNCRRPLRRSSFFADMGENPILQWHMERSEAERQVQILFGTKYPKTRKLEVSILE